MAKKITADVDDLRKVYLHAYSATATDPTIVEQEVDGINGKYARELLKVLTDGNLVVVEDMGGEDAWVPNLNLETNSQQDAEAAFNDWANDNGLQVKEAKTSKPKRVDVGAHDCYCGCGEQVGGKSFYRPGHDARHAGQIGRLVASTGDKKHYDALPSEALTNKAKGIAAKVLEKQDAKRKNEAARKQSKIDKASATPTKADDAVLGKVRVGKGTFEARAFEGGRVEYKSTDGTWKDASKTAAKTFKVA
jgi:hypothetical protein